MIWMAPIIFIAGGYELRRVLFQQEAPVASAIPPVKFEIREPLSIEMTGSHYRWQIRYPGADNPLLINDDVLTERHVHVPVGTNIRIVLKSDDYVYVLSFPEFGLKEIAVPSLEFCLTFRPTVLGQFALDGDELCGDPHPELRGQLIVESRDEFLTWLERQGKQTLRQQP